MQPLYKYLKSEYLDVFLTHGQIRFQALSYYRQYEELEIRGDRHEGVRIFAPKNGLEVNKVESGELLRLPMAFESKVKDRQIFVFCLSTILSSELATEFQTDVCVEIFNPEFFINSIQRSLNSRPSLKCSPLVHGAVSYYDAQSPPLAAWAVPEQVVLTKLSHYEKQAEYRLAFGRRGAFDIENVKTQLTTQPGKAESLLGQHPKVILNIGSLQTISTIHKF